MKRVLTLALVAVLLGANSLAAKTINVNIVSGNGGNQNQALDGTSAEGVVAYTGTTWNDLSGTITSANLNDSDGNPSGIGVSRTADGGNAQAGFTFSQTDGLVANEADILDNYLAATNGFGPPLAGPVVFQFTGLDPAATYDFHFVAVGDTPGQGASLTLDGTTLTTSGTSPDGPLAAGDNFVSFIGLTGNSALDLTLEAGPGNAAFAAISGFQIVQIPEPASLALLSLGMIGVVSVRRK